MFLAVVRNTESNGQIPYYLLLFPFAYATYGSELFQWKTTYCRVMNAVMTKLDQQYKLFRRCQ